MDMVERVARAIWDERVRNATGNGIDLGPFEAWAEANNIYGEARAAIGAMRELPDDLRWNHGYDREAFAPEATGVSSIQFDPKPIWERLVDAALAAPAPGTHE